MQTNRAVCCVATRCHDMFDFWRATVSQDLWMLKSLQLRSLLLWTLSCSTTGPAWRTHRKPITSLVFMEKFQVVKLNMIVVFPKVLWTKKQRKPETYQHVMYPLFVCFSCVKSQHLIVKDYEVTMDHQVEGSGHVALEDSGVNCGRLKPPCPSSTARRWCPDGMMISWIIFGLV